MQVIEPDILHPLTTGRRYAVLYHRRRLINAAALAMADAAGLGLAIALAGLTRWLVFGTPMVPNWSGLLIVGWWSGSAVAHLLPGWGLGAVEELRRTMLMLGLLFLGTALLMFVTKTSEAYSRLTVTFTFVYAVPLLPYFRTLAKKGLILIGHWGLPAAIYGGGEAGRQVVEALHNEGGLGYIPVAVFDDDPDSWGSRLDGVPVLGPTTQSTDIAPLAIVALPDLHGHSLSALLDGPLAHYKQTVIVPDLVEMPTLWVRSRDIGGVIGLEVTSNLLDPLARLLKRSLDLVLVIAFMPVWLPLIGLLALAVRLADGRVPLYFQTRLGQDGRHFRTIKFRTMVPGAEQVLLDTLASDPALRAEWETHFKLRRDPRVTRLGAWLRRTSLDELPQLVNVLRGEMSLVGPRPLPLYHHEHLSSRTQRLRLRLRPGLTGLWQVSGRSDNGNDGLERWDAYYVRNWSIWLDLVILARTVRALFHREGAY